MLLSVFASAFIRLACNFIFYCCVLVWFWYQRTVNFIKSISAILLFSRIILKNIGGLSFMVWQNSEEYIWLEFSGNFYYYHCLYLLNLSSLIQIYPFLPDFTIYWNVFKVCLNDPVNVIGFCCNVSLVLFVLISFLVNLTHLGRGTCN